MKASILDLRKHMGKILKALDHNESVTLTYRGREKATIVPKTKASISDASRHSTFGLWSDRKDLKDVDAAVRRIRKARFNAV